MPLSYLGEAVEEDIAGVRDVYYIGGGQYKCMDTGFTGTYAEMFPDVPKLGGPVNKAAKDARDALRPHGFKALTGTKKQKDWAEKIRLEKMADLSDEAKGFYAIYEGLPLHKASFWIEHRAKPVSEFRKFEQELVTLSIDLKQKVADGMNHNEASDQYLAFVAKFESKPVRF